MPRSIKRIAHDLHPLSDAVNELSVIISRLLSAIQPHIQFDEAKAEKYFEECIKATEKLAISSSLIKKYISEVNAEADTQGIAKD